MTTHGEQIGDLGVQKGLIKWILSAYANIPYPSEESLPSTSLPSHTGPSPSILTQTPHSPPMEETSVLPAPETPKHNAVAVGGIVFPPTPASPANGSLDSTRKTANPMSLPDKLTDAETMKAKKRLEVTLHLCPEGYKPEDVYPFEGIDGMSVETLKSRLGGKKLK
jgi:DNA-3-methyladenine glycosylase II